MNEFTNESRVLKQVNSLIKNNVFKKITIIALGSEQLSNHEYLAQDIELYRVNLVTRKLPKKPPFQLVKYLEFLIKSLLLIRKLKPSVVNAHALSVLPICFLAKKLLKAPLVYDAHELETEQGGEMGLRKRLSKKLERKLIYSADMMLVVSENIADWYVNEYAMPRPPVIMNAPVYQEPPKSDVFREKFAIRPDQVIFLYQGGLAKGRGVKLLLDAFKARTDDKAVMVFMGYGELEEDIQHAMQTSNNIFFHPAVAPNVVLEHTVAADVGIHMIQNTCLNHYYCMPNKLFEYAMAGLPVIVSNMKEMREFVERYDFGLVAEEGGSAGLNQAIDQMLVRNLATMKANAKQAGQENSWEHQEQKMLNAYAKLLNKEKHHDVR